MAETVGVLTMECISIDHVQFSRDSIDTIEELRGRLSKVSSLSWVVPSSAMAIIFLGNKPLQSAYNITQTDFELMTKALGGLPHLARRIVKDKAGEMYLRTSGKESKFWKGIYYGCEF